MQDLLGNPRTDAGSLLRDAPLHDLEWFDQIIEWQLVSLGHVREMNARPGVKAASLPEEERAARVPDENLQEFRRHCEQVRMQVRDVLYDKRVEARRLRRFWAFAERLVLVVLAALLGWLFVYLFPPPGS